MVKLVVSRISVISRKRGNHFWSHFFCHARCFVTDFYLRYLSQISHGWRSWYFTKTRKRECGTRNEERGKGKKNYGTKPCNLTLCPISNFISHALFSSHFSFSSFPLQWNPKNPSAINRGYHEANVNTPQENLRKKTEKTKNKKTKQKKQSRKCCLRPYNGL